MEFQRFLDSCQVVQSVETKGRKEFKCWPRGQTHSKYLGVILDQRLTYQPHIEYIKKNYTAAEARLYPILNKDSKMSTNNKLLIYKSILRSLISYAVPI
ncbi:hypothetical protein AVEN_94723-1 [Araneus ventricosus]|uniref:Uncharacterized protein n=1 Tax=Araneus ventricosus TaxID=182803 RepID=A0A4Y2CLX9_ARAVE|nr:hypothetical protein AVEN_94723-1 [Araneus ventricosus]